MPVEIKTMLRMTVDLNKYYPSFSKHLRDEISAEISKLANGNSKDVKVQPDLPHIREPGKFSASLTDTCQMQVLDHKARAGIMLAIVKAIHAKWAPGKTILLGDLRLTIMAELERAKHKADGNAVNTAIHNMVKTGYVRLREGF